MRQVMWLSLLALFSVSCASSGSTVASAPERVVNPDPEYREYAAAVRKDLAVLVERDRLRDPEAVAREEDRRSLRIGSTLAALRMPVAGVEPNDLQDNFGYPRDGGKRSHRGIDIFAPRGTEVVASASGIVTYIGEQSLGGRCLWVTSADGTSFYYAHLDRWASGLRQGMRIRKGDLLGYVGTTGNAINTPPHLHFQIVSRDEALNPYPHLLRSTTGYATPVLSGGFGRR
ncbi:MAG: M23 family metallopeptidase [Acidobacteria bacterium]|nr:M23 family metallopeptidase [Acidobacteriota bacterium]